MMLASVARRRTLPSTLSSTRSFATRSQSKPPIILSDERHQTPPPFYGYPRRRLKNPEHGLLARTTNDASRRLSPSMIGFLRRFNLLIENAVTAVRDPTRDDAVGAIGELTGVIALNRILENMKNDPVGRIILLDKPLVSKEKIPNYRRLMHRAEDMIADGRLLDDSDFYDDSDLTFGEAYGCFLVRNGFDPDHRCLVKYIDDPELSYVMLRYRQCHDFFHVLTGLPPNVVGELGLKWLELFQTGLPLTAFSCAVGPLTLLLRSSSEVSSTTEELALLYNVYFPWAQRVSREMRPYSLMNVYYEKEFDTPLVELRRRLNIELPTSSLSP